MTDTPERALLRRLVEWYELPTHADGSLALSCLLRDARALLAQPALEGEDASELSNAGVFLSPEDNLVVFVNHRSAVESVTFKGARLKDVTLPPTPPAARVEALVDKALRFDLDQAGIEQRERDAVELVELRARLAVESAARSRANLAVGVAQEIIAEREATIAAYRPLPRAEAEAMVVADYLYEADNWEYTWQPDDFKDTLADMDYDKRIVRVGRLKALPDQFAARVPIGEPDEEGDYEYSEWRYFATEAEARAALLRALTKEGT